SARRGMELDPYYVAPSFALSIDAQHEGVEFAVTTEIETDARGDSAGADFALDESTLDAVFVELAGTPDSVPGDAAPSALHRAREALAEGRLADAGIAAGAALATGESPVDALVLAGRAFAAQ